MNYRHAFHAGNFADVHKHVVLLALIERLKLKPKPLLYLDTHAGRGSYDVASDEAARGDEYRSGAARILDAKLASTELRRYQDLISSAMAPPTPRYPGSPLLAAQSLRDIDRIVLVEQQITEAHALERAIKGRRNASVVCGDGYAALKAYLPPRENRGLVLIDPPYESVHEFDDVSRSLAFGLRRWPNGVFAVWHPVKATTEAPRLHARLREAGLKKLLLLELDVRPADSPVGLNGSAMIVANPPWRFDEDMKGALAELHAVLDPQRAGGVRIEWLAPE
jgi:23S rRNA (adenine2030-N6)-methyltransferase